jgi:hypothetical protein
MAANQTLESMAPPILPASAVAWIDERGATVAAITRHGTISTCDIGRGRLSEPAYLAQVVRVIGNRQRVAILGPGSLRLALEQAYVATFRRADRLVDVEPAGETTLAELLDRLSTLAG